ncbi:dihydroorotate dehydrogenase electron transfer subunit [Porphyromonas loveana]|uniref:dihydroorotate dehydrogenase electron transfer subunit n=1 Tax=Porphyromonas loveana TaxID=1884669 RepID=UPI00359FC8F9
MKYNHRLQVVANKELNDSYFLLTLAPFSQEAAFSLPEILPGQFVQVLTEASGAFLRRPISVCDVDYARQQLLLLVQKVGKGTHALAHLTTSDTVDLLYPLGNGFTFPNQSSEAYRPLLVGGGVGTAPMLYLARCMCARGIEPNVLLGARTADLIVMRDHFEEFAHLHVTTEDGSMGVKGFVTDHPALREGAYTHIYVCGPKAMMVAVASLAHKRAISCEVSLENTMACGIGACLCCVENTKEGNLCVCTEGPVFNIDRLQWF